MKFLDGDGLARVWEKIKDTFAYKTDIKTPNWDASEEESGYIENRTHYKTFGAASSFANGDPITFVLDNEYAHGYAYGFNDYPEGFMDLMEEGNYVSLTINGSKYEGVWKQEGSSYWIGNRSIRTPEAEDTGEDFYIGTYSRGFDNIHMYLDPSFVGTYQADDLTFEEAEVEYVQLDERYIPSTIARTASIPIVDQTYDSSSSHAMSGTAVAEAIAPIQEVIPVTATSSNQLVDTNTLVDAIQQQVTEYIAPDASMIVPFEHATYMGGANNLEEGPWFKDGLQCGAEGSPTVYVTENDYAVVLQDESVCYFEAHGFRYQRHKDGGASSYGYVVLPDANHTTVLIQAGVYDSENVLYFIDNSGVFSTDPIYYIVTSLTVLSDSVVETDSLSGSPIATYDLNFPTTRYVCTSSQTDNSAPVWSFNYTVNDTALTGNQIQALNSGINSTLVNKLANLSYDDLQNKPTVKIGSDAAETLESIEVTKTEVTANNDRYWNLTITANGNKTLTTVVPEVDQNFNRPASRAAISTAAVNGALAGKIDASDFATFKKTVILKDGYVEPASGGGSQTPLAVVTTENNVNMWVTVSGTTSYEIKQDPSTKSNFWAAVDIYNIEEVYVSGNFEKVRYCLTDGAGTNSITFNSAQDVIDFIDSKTTTVETSTTYTRLTCSFAENLNTTKSWSRHKIENTSNNKLLIMYFGNALSGLDVTAASLEPAFLDTIDQTSINAVQSNVLYTEFAKYTKTADLPTVPTKTSDLTNDGEGGSPASRFVEEWELEATTADLDYIVGENS